jgi:hypothetical protein
MAVSDELGSMWREVVMVYFKSLFQHIFGETSEMNKNPVKIVPF